MLVAFVLGFGGSMGQLGLLLHESVHVCTCSLADHDCDCPHCRGPHVAAPGESDEPALAVDQVPCGEETGARAELVFARALLLPARAECPPARVSALKHLHREPPASPSRLRRAPEPPPPRAG